MVLEYGMSPKFGPLAFEAKRGSVFLDGGFTAQKEYSEETAREIDQEVGASYTRPMRVCGILLTKRRDDLERLARRLLDKEVVEEKSCAMLGASPATSPA